MQVIPAYENQIVEFKSQWGDGQTIKKTLVAFANTNGGDLYIGINDDGTVCGLDDVHDIEERLCSTMRDNIFPSIGSIVTMTRLMVDGKTVLQVHVDRGRFPPYSIGRAGDLRQTYVRVGCTNSPATFDDITKMVERNNPTPYEQRQASNQALTFRACMAYCSSRGVEFNPKTNTNFGFWDPQREGWTNLAYLCSDQGTARFVMVHSLDEEQTRILDSKKVEGCLFVVLEEALKFVADTNYAGMEKPKDGTLERIDHYRVNPDAVREAIVNQLAHCDYSRNVPCTILITPRRIDFWSAGGPYNLQPRDILENLATSCRNEKLAFLLNRLGLMEGIGSGFRLIRSIYRNTPLDRLVTITDSSVKISLPRARLISMDDFDNRERQVLEYVTAVGEVSRKDVMTLLGISSAMSSNMLSRLVQKRALVKQGAGPRTRYTLSPDVENLLPAK